MSSLQNHSTRMEKAIHRAFHEIEERVDVDADKVAEIVELWEEWRDKHLVKRKENDD